MPPVSLEAVGPVPEALEAFAVPYYGVEGCQQTQTVVQYVVVGEAATTGVLADRPVPAAPVHSGLG
jgi:hypothetical protein